MLEQYLVDFSLSIDLHAEECSIIKEEIRKVNNQHTKLKEMIRPIVYTIGTKKIVLSIFSFLFLCGVGGGVNGVRTLHLKLLKGDTT